MLGKGVGERGKNQQDMDRLNYTNDGYTAARTEGPDEGQIGIGTENLFLQSLRIDNDLLAYN